MKNGCNQYNLNFEKLCDQLALGKLIKEPETLVGGHLHRMFALETTQGKYAVKTLNPQIMARPTALKNYIKAEKIVSIVSKHVTAQPAKILKGAFLQNIDNQYYMIFDWIEGHTLKPQQITVDNCKRMGSLLADIHKTDYSLNDLSADCSHEMHEIDWDFYLNKGKEMESIWVNLLSDNIEKLYLWSTKARHSEGLLTSECVFSHRDLEPKNVMWIQDRPIIIDWESAGEINPKHDLVETAVYWSLNACGQLAKEKFYAFVSAYQARCPVEEADWRIVLELGYSSKLEWLAYSLKRSLQIECTDQMECEMGTNHAIETIKELNAYEERISVLEEWLNHLV